MKNNTILLLLSMLIALQIFSQDIEGYFRAPLKIPLLLSGNFGELRSGHFHAGLDIKTQGKEGLEVVAAADGFVSRIKVSLYGYGKALYLTHPNGYTTVYAHLQKFAPEIEAYVRKQQYLKNSFEIEVFPSAQSLLFKQGDVIAFSGNTGGSGGPHLHFEIRNSKTEIPLNPLMANFDIADNIAPIIKTLGIYPLNPQSTVNGSNEPQFFKLKKNGNTYIPAGTELIKVHGKIGFGIEAIDNVDNSSNICGVYSIDLYKNNVLVYKHEMNQIAFHEGRYINAHVDFYGWKKYKQKVQKSFIDPNNKLTIYKDVVNKGQLFFLEDTIVKMYYTVNDFSGNISFLKFDVVSESNSNLVVEYTEPKADFFDFKQSNFIETDWFTASFPPYIFYDNLYFHHWIEYHNKKDFLSPIFHLADVYTPIHSYFSLNVHLDSLNNLPLEKLLIVALDDKGKILAAEGGSISNGYLSVRTRSLGPYTVMIDTIQPTIRALFEGNTLPKNQLRFKIADELSGINTYNAYVNGKWVLAEFDNKTGILFCDYDQYWDLSKDVSFKLEVTDKKGNRSFYSKVFAP